ncbi:hypothetical protein BD408DRAFT_355160 [Parasitella parasitica]|nr:hypothetical protein BD408DRAFT_355160 [Parasitella parasitica]
MKINIKQLLLPIGLLLSSILAQSNSNLEPTFQNGGQKNIAFFCVVGGASHYNWVLNIGDELGRRGHNFTFLTAEDDMRFGSPYKNVQTVSTGPGADWDATEIFNDGFKELATKNPALFMSQVMDLMFSNFERDYLFTRQFFIDNRIDVALCDHFADPCVEAATNLSIPYIITAAMDTTKDTSAPYVNNDVTTMNFPTTETQSFVDRFKTKFVTPIVNIRAILPALKKIQARKNAIGIDAKLEDPSYKWRHAIKLTNVLFGFTPARPLGPLAEFIGPIIPQQYKPLTDDLKTFLDAHQRVAYIAFGHAATPSESDIHLILSGLLESVERGYLDGFIWATVHAAGRFQESITTSSGTIYNVQDMFDHVNPHARMVKWAPQTAILHHPSTVLFVSHGGLGSWYESMYSGTRMIVFPFFGDQIGNAVTIETSKLGSILKSDHSVEEAVELFRKTTMDETGEIADSLKRTQALVQIYSRNGVVRGADIVEEVAYTNKDGKLLHRESADHRMSYLKSHNLDIYGALALILFFLLWVLVFIAKRAFSLIFRSSSAKTVKIL